MIELRFAGSTRGMNAATVWAASLRKRGRRGRRYVAVLSGCYTIFPAIGKGVLSAIYDQGPKGLPAFTYVCRREKETHTVSSLKELTFHGCAP